MKAVPSGTAFYVVIVCGQWMMWGYVDFLNSKRQDISVLRFA